jgi:hypothetical protein
MRELERIKARYTDAASLPLGAEDGSVNGSGEHIVLGPAAVAAATGLGGPDPAARPGGSGEFGSLLSSGSCPVSISGGGGLATLGSGAGRTAIAPWGLPVIHDDGEEAEGEGALSGGGHARSPGSRGAGSVAAAVKMWETGAQSSAGGTPRAAPSGGAGSPARSAPGSGSPGGGSSEDTRGMSSVYFEDGFGSSHAHGNGHGRAPRHEDAGATLTGAPTMTDVVPMPAGVPLADGAAWLRGRASSAGGGAAAAEEGSGKGAAHAGAAGAGLEGPAAKAE